MTRFIRNHRIPVLSVMILLLAIACNNKEDSAFGEILNNPPYSDITDSIEKQPKNAELYFRRAVRLNRNNLPEVAYPDFAKAWQLSKKEQYAVAMGNLLLDRKPDSGIVFLRSALNELPKSYLLRLTLARSYDARNNTKEALQATHELLQQYPEQLDALLLKAELLQKTNDSVQALAALEKAYSLAPQSGQIISQLAYQYAEFKNPKALALADTMLFYTKKEPSGHPYYIKGVYYTNVGNTANAIRFFDETIRVDYNYMNAYIEKGKLQLQQKQPKEALKTFKLANTISPAFPDAWYWIGRALEVSGDKAAAKEYYQKAYGLDKTFTDAKEAAEKL